MNTPHDDLLASDEEIRKALTFFKIMAFVVGIALLILTVEMIFSYGLGWKGKDNPLSWWPAPHGFLYMIYAVAAFFLGLRMRWPFPKLIGVLLAGCVPFLSFVVEAKIEAETTTVLAERAARVSDVDGGSGDGHSG
ncbi:hypothetical protein KEM60_00935 [Austwickia sp. TVS 96-490-7B]|uniref:DUF3817 domain-containing protein n=1 Tax=Austwickia sp. TVS 96-490-7B TaxID=2830843 RepID=UPI001C55FB02|nr:DUF3817 domain-containing protein [Austwickia sp. TVS 96-490-7B]MBW3084746.1 hypothetical protein [Austwickia sp. TVS 96-490-7B]